MCSMCASCWSTLLKNAISYKPHPFTYSAVLTGCLTYAESSTSIGIALRYSWEGKPQPLPMVWLYQPQ